MPGHFRFALNAPRRISPIEKLREVDLWYADDSYPRGRGRKAAPCTGELDDSFKYAASDLGTQANHLQAHQFDAVFGYFKAAVGSPGE